jgi:hypothetical protein
LIVGLYETDHVKDLDADIMQELLIPGHRDHVSSREFEFRSRFAWCHICHAQRMRAILTCMDSDFEDHDGPIAGPSRIEPNLYQSSSVLETPPAVSYPNLGDTQAGTKVKPQKLRREPNGTIDCYQ